MKSHKHIKSKSASSNSMIYKDTMKSMKLMVNNRRHYIFCVHYKEMWHQPIKDYSTSRSILQLVKVLNKAKNN